MLKIDEGGANNTLDVEAGMRKKSGVFDGDDGFQKLVGQFVGGNDFFRGHALVDGVAKEQQPFQPCVCILGVRRVKGFFRRKDAFRRPACDAIHRLQAQYVASPGKEEAEEEHEGQPPAEAEKFFHQYQEVRVSNPNHT